MEDVKLYDLLQDYENNTNKLIRELVSRANYYEYDNVPESEQLNLYSIFRIPELIVIQNTNNHVTFRFKNGRDITVLISKENCLLIRNIINLRQKLNALNININLGGLNE